MPDLAVVCVCVGDRYGPEYPENLASAVSRNLMAPHDFLCFTDNPALPMWMLEPALNALPGWWQKPSLFGLRGFDRYLYLDLDTIVVGSLDALVEVPHPFCAIQPFRDIPRNRGKILSGVMVWDDGFGEEILRGFPTAAPPKGYPGDQDWISEKASELHTFPPGWVVSYKHHCLGKDGPPPGARVVAFHGVPRPHEVSDPWVKEAWR